MSFPMASIFCKRSVMLYCSPTLPLFSDVRVSSRSHDLLRQVGETPMEGEAMLKLPYLGRKYDYNSDLPFFHVGGDKNMFYSLMSHEYPSV